ncbi:hypothetical protein TL16_g10978 [Triparma laevis f. inornata]|uniref:Uncharacterized protein n=1 Tax=Triparma laevis f. inornata TaxID=1714386 RepID=A0A9W7BKG6_9STRA|nr:hypothetical protein TL16_g10978 [Triparma laevis f. inornata]
MTVVEIMGYIMLSKFAKDQIKLFASLPDDKLRKFVFEVLPHSIAPTLLSIAFLQAESMSCFFENWNEAGLSVAICTDKSHSTNVFSAVFVTVSTIRIFVLPFIDYTLDHFVYSFLSGFLSQRQKVIMPVIIIQQEQNSAVRG